MVEAALDDQAGDRGGMRSPTGSPRSRRARISVDETSTAGISKRLDALRRRAPRARAEALARVARPRGDPEPDAAPGSRPAPSRSRNVRELVGADEEDRSWRVEAPRPQRVDRVRRGRRGAPRQRDVREGGARELHPLVTGVSTGLCAGSATTSTSSRSSRSAPSPPGQDDVADVWRVERAAEEARWSPRPRTPRRRRA